jgi:1-phosphofructokinase family hexose kinase
MIHRMPTPPRLLVCGPNLTTDRTAALPELRPGDVLRTREVTVTPGGKGVNVVRAARALGARARLVGFVPGRLGPVAAAMLRDEGVALTGIACDGELRNATILREDSGRVTVINEPGPRIGADDWTALEDAVASAMPDADLLLCSGSVPPGSPPDAFRRLTALGQAVGVPVLVDASGTLLGAALAGAPDVVTPNLAEARTLLDGAVAEGVEVEADRARDLALDAAAALRGRGAAAAVVTAGAAGVAVAHEGGVAWLPAPVVTVVNPIGAGDAFAAGLAVGLARGEPLLDAAVLGVATGSASVEEGLAGALRPGRAAELRRALRG